MLVVFSTSGNSPNVLRELASAHEEDLTTVALLGKGPRRALAGKADYEIIVPARDSARVQEVHTFVMHVWLEQIGADSLRRHRQPVNSTRRPFTIKNYAN